MELRRRLRATYDEGGTGLLVRKTLEEVVRSVRDRQSFVVSRWARDRVMDRSELLAQASDSVWTFGTRETVTIDAESESLPPEFERFVGTHTAREPFVCELPRATLAGFAPIAFDGRGRIVLESVENEPSVLESRLEELVRRRGALATLRVLKAAARGDPWNGGDPDYEVAFPLVRHPSTNYYHWLLGYVEKVRALERYESATGRDPVVLVAPDAANWVTDSLSLAGLNRQRTVEWTDDLASVGTLVVPMHRSRHDRFTPSPESCRWLRRRIVSNVPADLRERDWSSRVYVSRQDALDRRVVNEGAVADVLSEFGFESYTLTDLSFPEQVALFSQAECVVGPHGAGLVNTVFARDPSVVELLPAGTVRHHYFVLARQLDYDYDYLLCESDGTDLVVDVEELRKLVDGSVGQT